MRFINRKTLAVAGAAAALVAVSSTTTAVAGHLVGSADIQNGSIRSVDIKDGHVRTKDLSADAIAKLQGKDGKDGLAGAFYATAFYDAGDTNAGAIATVACDPTSSAFTAIAGGVQVTGLDAGANSRNTPVSSSFPGRMDWNTNAPKANRLDGWIVQFGGNAGASSDKAPEKVKVWALCVPNTSIPVHQTYTQTS
jgi:hypothetical protein